MDVNGFDERNRKLTITSVGALTAAAISPPFVVLLPAYCARERIQTAGLTRKLINLGCVEFCCVGPDAELLHDAIDEIIEAEGALEVLTTWIEDPAEGCEYFLHAAAAGRANLLAPIQRHPRLQVILEEALRHESAPRQ